MIKNFTTLKSKASIGVDGNEEKVKINKIDNHDFINIYRNIKDQLYSNAF